MRLTLREVEPFNIPPVDNGRAALFMRRLTGRETFHFSGNRTPKAMLLYELKFDQPRHSYARGFLLSVDVGAFQRACASEPSGTVGPILRRHVIGGIRIEYDGPVEGVRVSAEELEACPNPACQQWLPAGGNFCTHCGMALRSTPVAGEPGPEATTTANCPHCEQPFDAMAFPWTCPVCNRFDSGFNLLKTCDHCGFGPRLIQCPACRKMIEGQLLMFTVKGPRKAVIPYEALPHADSFQYKFVELRATPTHGLNEEELRAIGAEALKAMFNAEFHSYLRIPLYRLISHRKSPDGTHWLHAWALRTASDNEPLAQIVLHYPASEGAGAETEIRIVDVLIDLD